MNIENVEIVDELKQSYLDYAMDVIIDRALPDARDGLKPVHRRILYAMYDLKIFHDHTTVKSARVVGEVIGKYHPHGDTAVYDSIVRMAQDFSLRYPLIEGQGNFGSIDKDPAAAMRYTEVRLERISDEMLADLNKETVDLKPNYDNSLMIPDYVLPTKIPNLLVNGSSGIAVGLATNIPTHNITEVLDGTLALIDNPNLSSAELMQYIQGPDFPTGGVIYGRDGIYNAYTTGKGRVILRAKYHVETANDGRQTIVIDEIPYGVVKLELVKQIRDLILEKKISGISDICDRSGKDVGIRVEIELKQGEFSEVVINHLFKLSMLQSSFPVNMVAIVKGRPQTLTLKDCLQCFIDHRKEVVTRRFAFDLRKARDRAHIVEGQLAAQDNLDEVVRIIRSSQTRDEARTRLFEKEWPIHIDPNVDNFATLLARCGKDCRPLYVKPEFGLHNGVYRLTLEQVNNILDMRLSQLVRLAKEDLFKEYQEQAQIVARCLEVLNSIEELQGEIKKELIDIRERYGDERRTEIIETAASIEMEDLIKPRDVVVTLSQGGYVKYQSLEDFNTQTRGGTGRKGASLKDDDAIYKIVVANVKDYLLCFTNLGKVYCIKVYQLPEGSFYSRGRPIVNTIPIQEGESITAFLPISSFDEGKYIVLATKNGLVKKTSLAAYSKINKLGKKIINFRSEDDRTIGVGLTDGKGEIILVTANGMVNRFSELKNAEPSPFVLETISNPQDEEIETEETLDNELEESNTNDEATDLDEENEAEDQKEVLRAMGSAAAGVRGIKLLNDDYVVALIIPKVGDGNKILFATDNGQSAKIQIARFARRVNRSSQGIRSMRFDADTKLIGAMQVQDQDQIMLMTVQGRIIRTFINQIRETARGSKGVKLIRLNETDNKLIAMERIVIDPNEAESLEAPSDDQEQASANESNEQ